PQRSILRVNSAPSASNLPLAATTGSSPLAARPGVGLRSSPGATAAGASVCVGSEAVDFLDGGLARVFATAGLGDWGIPAGHPDMPLKFERSVPEWLSAPPGDVRSGSSGSSSTSKRKGEKPVGVGGISLGAFTAAAGGEHNSSRDAGGSMGTVRVYPLS